MKYLPPRSLDLSNSSPKKESPAGGSAVSYWDEQRAAQQHDVRTVCVIGLGPAGLVAVKELRAHGLHATAYESASRLGGRYCRATTTDSHHYLVTPDRAISEFSDFAWHTPTAAADTHDDEMFPTYGEAQAYLESYAHHFQLEDSLHFDTTVTRIDYNESHRTWTVATRPTHHGADEGRSNDVVQHFDAVVVSCGRRHLLGDDESTSAFLSPSLQSDVFRTDPATGRPQLRLYQHTLVPSHPTLAFGGGGGLERFEDCVTGPAFPMWELCARYIAGIFSGQLLRPPRWQLEEGVVTATHLLQDGHGNVAATDRSSVLWEMADLVGASPSWWWRLAHHRSPRRVVYPCIFRLNTNDPHVAAAARKRFEECGAQTASTSAVGSAFRPNGGQHWGAGVSPSPTTSNPSPPRPSVQCC